MYYIIVSMISVSVVLLGVLLGHFINYLCSRINKSARKHFSKRVIPFYDIMDISVEYDKYDSICKRKKVCKKCFDDHSSCRSCALKTKDNNTYQMWKNHIEGCLSNAKTVQHLKNFKHYVKGMEMEHNNNKGNIKKALMVLCGSIISGSYFITLLGELNRFESGLITVISFLLLVYIIRFVDEIEARESGFYRDIIKITKNFIKKKEKQVSAETASI